MDATQSIGEQQRIMREYIDETLADYRAPDEIAREFAESLHHAEHSGEAARE